MYLTSMINFGNAFRADFILSGDKFSPDLISLLSFFRPYNTKNNAENNRQFS